MRGKYIQFAVGIIISSILFNGGPAMAAQVTPSGQTLCASNGQAHPQAQPPIRVSSYKGTTLKPGEVSGLVIFPSDTAYTVVSSDPDVVSAANMLGHWTAIAKGSGTVTITVTAPDGRTGSVTITVGSVAPTVESSEDNNAQTPEPEIQQEMIQLINQTRRANGVPELSVNDALMEAAQACSDRLYTWHHNREECEAVAASGYPNGFGSNLTVFTGTVDVAQHAVTNWINSPGHFQTMIDPGCDSIGVGITENQGITYS